MAKRSGTSRTGQQPAELLARRLAADTFDVVYVSDLSRAWDTAQTILMYHPGVPIHAEPRLREPSKGAWGGAADPDLPRAGHQSRNGLELPHRQYEALRVEGRDSLAFKRYLPFELLRNV